MIPENVTECELGRVYFVVSSKYDEVDLTVYHNPARQRLILPAYPSSAVEEASLLLNSGAAHYVLQWQKIMVEELHRDARGFSVPGDHLPQGIAPTQNATGLLEIVRKHVVGLPEGEAFLEPGARVFFESVTVDNSNLREFAHEAEVFNEYDIELLEPPPLGKP